MDKSKNIEWVSPTLKRADEIIHGERQDMYGEPEDSFTIIAAYWTVYMQSLTDDSNGKCSCCGIEITAADVAIMMTLFKLARMSGQKWHRDNAIDAAGYMAILNDRIMVEDD